MSKLNWQRLQVAMNNFKIDQLMSYTDIKNKLALAMKNAHSKSSHYPSAKLTAELIKKLDHKDDFIQDNSNNQKLFKKLQKSMNPLVGYAKVNDPTTRKLNALYQQAADKDPKAMKQFNLRAHKVNHMSAPQAMLNVMGREIKHEKK